MTVLQLPDRLPILAKGKQPPGSGRVCAEQAVNWLVSDRLTLDDESDSPECVQPILNQLTIAVNDSLPDSRRGEMWPIILRQPGTAHAALEPRLSMDLGAFLCRWVVQHWPVPSIDPVTKEALEAAAACLGEPNEANRERVARAAEAAWAARAAWAAEVARAAEAAEAAEAEAAARAAWAAEVARAAEAAEAEAARATGLLAMLTATQGECERLTGHEPGSVDLDRLGRLCDLVGTR